MFLELSGDCSGESTAALWSKPCIFKKKEGKKSSFSGLYQKLPYWQVDQTLLGTEVAVIVFCHEISRKTVKIGAMRFFHFKAALYMSNVSQELKQKCTFFIFVKFINLYVFVFFQGALE